MAAGTRTAPTINGTPVYKQVSIKMIDNSGDVKSDAFRFPTTVLASEIETWVAAYQAVTQSSVYRVDVSDVYAAVEDADDAEVGTRDSVYDVLDIRVRNTLGVGFTAPIRAPEPGTMLGNKDEIDPDSSALGTYFTALLAVMNGGAGGSGTYSVISARYSERREINAKVKI